MRHQVCSASVVLHLPKLLASEKFVEIWKKVANIVLNLVEGPVIEDVGALDIVLVFVKYPARGICVYVNVQTFCLEDFKMGVKLFTACPAELIYDHCICVIVFASLSLCHFHNHLHFLYSANIVAIFLFQYFPCRVICAIIVSVPHNPLILFIIFSLAIIVKISIKVNSHLHNGSSLSLVVIVNLKGIGKSTHKLTMSLSQRHL